MKVVRSIKDMQRHADAWRREGKVIGLSPTLGNLHEGHLSLMREARRRSHVSVISIFLNPLQFGPNEDLEKYPKTWDEDLRKAESVGVDAVFAPPPEAMYPDPHHTYVTVEHLTEHLCGASRPGHFRGVTTVVAKLFLAVKPHLAFFGEKDYQQLKIIEAMVRDLNMDLDIVPMPLVRDEDGVATSSRNAYLSAEERRSARSLHQALALARRMLAGGEKDAARLIAAVGAHIEAQPHTRIDYVSICDPESFRGKTAVEGPTLCALAVFVGQTRLIDNCRLL